MSLCDDNSALIRSNSATPRMETSQNDNSTSWSLDDHRDLNYIRISSWKFMKAKKGGVYAIYPVHVFMKSGLHWTVDKRYSEFLDLHKELCRVFQKPRELEFPKKRWFFNFSEDCLVERKEKFEAYLTEILAMKPIPLELNYFLNVAQNLRYNAAGIENGMKRSASMGSLSAALSIHDFDLIKVLGQGSFGKVFLVRPVGAPAEEVYAMKALKKAEVEKRKQVDHTMAERRIMAMTTSPFVLRLRYAFQTPHKLYMVTDYCSGGELFFHLKKMRRFSESMMRFYTAELSMALHHLHARNIIYRDMKPENVLLDRFGHVKLTDFGLSKVLSSEVAADGTKKALYATTFCGTPEYLAPEIIQGNGYGWAVDWWAMGILLFEMVAGYPPFYDQNPFGVYKKILRGDIKFPSGIAATTQSAIKGFLNSRRFRRLGCTNKSCLESLKKNAYFSGIDWIAAEQMLILPPYVPTYLADGDTSNFDFYPEESIEDTSNLTADERNSFAELDVIVGRPAGASYI
mmetsp:Transcript_2361/g.3617  ORF Transcript_2361/g.3617 Transcript_2361/m.3617 type:complete len:515 (+) Transcript_2361:165-1709(+)